MAPEERARCSPGSGYLASRPDDRGGEFELPMCTSVIRAVALQEDDPPCLPRGNGGNRVHSWTPRLTSNHYSRATHGTLRAPGAAPRRPVVLLGAAARHPRAETLEGDVRRSRRGPFQVPALLPTRLTLHEWHGRISSGLLHRLPTSPAEGTPGLTFRSVRAMVVGRREQSERGGCPAPGTPRRLMLARPGGRLLISRLIVTFSLTTAPPGTPGSPLSWTPKSDRPIRVSAESRCGCRRRRPGPIR